MTREYDYILDMNQSKFTDDMIINAVKDKQQLIKEGKCVGQLIQSDSDMMIDIAKISHMVTRLEYKQRQLRVTVKILNLVSGKAVQDMIDCGMLYPVIVGKAKKSDVTGEMIDWEIRSVGYMTTEVFPVKPYSDVEWNITHFNEDLFAL